MGKFGINAKAVEGRERKKLAAEAKEREKQAKLDAKEAAEWQKGAKDTAKQAALEAKRLEKLEKKKERERLEAEEATSIKSVKSVGKMDDPVVEKKTQFELMSQLVYSSRKSSTSSVQLIHQRNLPQEPLNRPTSTVSTGGYSMGGSSISEYSASNLEDAISLLEATNVSSEKINLERHPERRVKAAFALFEENEMPILKLENPSLRRSQLRELLKKNWAKAPENPFNQANISFRASREEEIEAARSMNENQLERFRAK